MYHHVREIAPTMTALAKGLSITPENLAKQLQLLKDKGYETIAIEDLRQHLLHGTKLPPKPVVLTFDDGYQDFYDNAMPVLTKFQDKATAYIITGYVGGGEYMKWDEIKSLDKNPLITIASHTVDHPDLTKLKTEQLLKEVQDSKKALETKLGHTIDDFCYPYGFNDAKVRAAIQAAGYLTATTTKSGVVEQSDKFFALPRLRMNSYTGKAFIDRWKMLTALSYWKI